MTDTTPILNVGILTRIQEGPPPDRMSSKPFIVKIQTEHVHGDNNPCKKLLLHDRSATLAIKFSSPVIYHLANECGVLTLSKWTTKQIFCWAYFKNKGSVLCIQTDNLAPFQT